MSDTNQVYQVFGRFMWLYGTSYSAEKVAFQETIREGNKMDQIPWIVCGYMNEVIWKVVLLGIQEDVDIFQNLWNQIL